MESVADESCPLCANEGALHFRTVRGRIYYRCPLCRATFLSRRQLPTPEEEQSRYEEHQNDPKDPGYRSFLSRLADPLLERLAPGREGLDFGCGPGPALFEMLVEAGHRMQCYDPFFRPETVALERRYDFVTATEVLEHLHEPRKTLSLLDRLVRPGGLVGVMTEFLTDDSRFDNWYYRRDRTHVIFYGYRTMEVIADQWGWKLDIPRKNVAIFEKARRP